MNEPLYAGSWHIEQGMPHSEPLFDYLKDSIGKVVAKESQEWVLVTVGSHKQVSTDLVAFEEILKKGKSER